MKTLIATFALLFLLLNLPAQAASKQELDVYVSETLVSETLTTFREYFPATHHRLYIF